jgi:hypothetical protein
VSPSRAAILAVTPSRPREPALRTAAQRQQRHKAKRREAGEQLARFWLPQADLDALKRRYPGPRGGIDWPAVVAASLAPAESPRPPQLLPPNAPAPAAEPFPYWKPGGPGTPLDERCQARNRDGSRCKSKGKLIVQALAPHGAAGEFNACERHRESFQPHPSVLASRPGR